MFIIGCHLSTEGGYRSMGERILSVGGKSFQYFTKNPKGGKQNKPADPDDVAALLALIRENGLEMPLAHAPYTYNPCSKDEGVRNYSRELRIECQKTGVSVTNAYFGAVDTPLIPLKAAAMC